MTVSWTRTAKHRGASGVIVAAALAAMPVLGAVGCSGETSLPNVNSRGGESNTDAENRG